MISTMIMERMEALITKQEQTLQAYQKILNVLDSVQSNIELLTGRVKTLEVDVQKAVNSQTQLELLQRGFLSEMESDRSLEELLDMLRSLERLATDLEHRYKELSNELNIRKF